MRFATADCETDPFRMGRYIQPFAWGFYDGDTYHQFWGDDCTERFLAHLRTIEEPLEIYAHNGGKFDWLFILKHLNDGMQMIGSRIVKATLGIHSLRDSYANMPVPLKMIGNKLEINIDWLERRNREKHKQAISDYLKADCVELYKAVDRYRVMFGAQALTMASAAMRELRKTMKDREEKLEKLSENQDCEFRTFYFGGRVQCFEVGNIAPDPGAAFHIYDVNSMYPAVMRDFKHPISNRVISGVVLDDRTDFAVIDCEQDGCLPARTDTGGITFKPGIGRYHASGHEIRQALELGKIKINKVISAHRFAEQVDFADFVNKFYDLRLEAKEAGDDMLVLFYKLVMNSAYGKAALDPRKFTEMCILPPHVIPDGDMKSDPLIYSLPEGPTREKIMRESWGRHAVTNDYVIWSRHINTKGRFLNVATAASITGAARSVLMAGLHHATRPIYCDTDSIICQSLDRELHDKKLGAWKHEGSADRAAIAGKKLYALWSNETPSDDEYKKRIKAWGDGTCVKLASKGVRLHANEVEAIAGECDYTFLAQAPTMNLTGAQNYVHRTIRRTA